MILTKLIILLRNDNKLAVLSPVISSWLNVFVYKFKELARSIILVEISWHQVCEILIFERITFADARHNMCTIDFNILNISTTLFKVSV